jgi:serine/threonine-protein kinase
LLHGAGVQLGGRYRLDERIGGGGMGEVWRGTDEVLGRTVAVKIMLPALLDEPGFAERFRAEARNMARLTHPGVVNVYDYGSDPSTAFLVMEYVEGDPLSRTLGRVGRLTAARTMALIAQAADALEAAHAAGIVHRDVKPGNLMVRPDGTLVLTDFGISRSELSGLTGTGTVLGTASYLSPEQASGQVATAASDVYALGVVGYQCLAGRRPFEGEGPLEIAMKHVREPPPLLPADIPVVVRDIVMRAMAKDPANRWPSAAALAAVARQVAASLGTGVVIPSPGPAGPVSGAPVSPPVGQLPLPRVPPPVIVPHHPAYQVGQAEIPTQPVPYRSPVSPAPPPAGGARFDRDRTSPLAVIAMILLAIAIVICAGLVGYVVRQLVDGKQLSDLFSMITYDQPIEGSMTT